MLFRTYLDSLHLNHVRFVLENGKSVDDNLFLSFLYYLSAIVEINM